MFRTATLPIFYPKRFPRILVNRKKKYSLQKNCKETDPGVLFIWFINPNRQNNSKINALKFHREIEDTIKIN